MPIRPLTSSPAFDGVVHERENPNNPSSSVAAPNTRRQAGLYKTTLTIWSDFSPDQIEIDELARDAVCGDSYCSRRTTAFVQSPDEDQDWDGTDFFTAPM